MYSMAWAMNETERRREKQYAYNQDHGIEPRTIVKEVRDLTGELAQRREMAVAESKAGYVTMAELPKDELNWALPGRTSRKRRPS